ncbi:hypothetical protein HanXRQr2_Chr13g0583151 [Helianthus annuus]|uniref:Uncharacterized protein n=1 Tax=Helianthus annuus TaxID=4232 RepID=A0A251SQL3_HELAN|nr:uncharacterized protein LOC110901067 [Helianthus annuus]KAF5772948.1 hypothetical protein HanXRQr2_Chr13g0583151 [Helianthus annuus]KAJ0476499.1 hypothetical protein HanHA300_Chr13g0478051 [Helianthus annuus]KAJ0480720.1 hypothetical protein HanIR_Chr13g0634851 [Helianthus annuus]KAJ0497326.1 hypothetical protein HanHA89_Chr13g0510161 [Helianthus annuus]KAJ0670840.1 hypothetical protein HanOQP8_Chr13g0479081 [Helianthus annuus]
MAKLRRSLEERRQLLQPCKARRMAEVVGGTTAEVTAVCCCFPCAAVDFTFLTMYKVPAGMCRNAIMRRRHRPRLMMPRNGKERRVKTQLEMHPAVVAALQRFVKPEMDKDMLALEDEMWKKFADSGFWRGTRED